MVEQIYSRNTRKIMQNKEKIESAFNIILSNKGKVIFINGKAENEYFALEVIEAINIGFTIDKALLLKEENMIFNKINIKDLTKRKDLERVRGRIIGTRRRVLETIESLTNCFISLHDNSIGIIGSNGDIEKARYALERIIQGAKHSNVYAYLEKQKALEKELL